MSAGKTRTTEKYITGGPPGLVDIEAARLRLQENIDSGYYRAGSVTRVDRHPTSKDPTAMALYLIEPDEPKAATVSELLAPARPAAPTPKSRRVPKARLQGEVILFHCHEQSAYHGGIYNHTSNRFLDGFPLTKLATRDARAHLCAMAGQPLPPVDRILPGKFHFTPGQHPQITKSPTGYVVNNWQEPALRQSAVPCNEMPPAIRTVLLHAMGGCTVSLQRFLNWLSVAYQFNCRTDTAWIWSGVEGTGKGLAFNEIIKPLFGPDYCQQLLVETLEDRFNPWAETTVMLNVDEADLGDRRQKATREKIRTLITGETVSVRGMHVAAREVPNHCNVILTSNATVVSDLPRSDRRFNVSPPQMHPLRGDTDALVKAIRSELPAFAGFLRDYQADRQLARTAMESVAKAIMTEAGETTPKAFANALRTGDLGWFLSQYFTITDGVDLGHRAMADALARWTKHAECASGESLFVTTAEATTCYNLILGDALRLSPVGVGRYLTTAGVASSQERGGARRRGYYVKWRLSEPLTAVQLQLLRMPAAAQRELEDAWLELDQPPLQAAA